MINLPLAPCPSPTQSEAARGDPIQKLHYKLPLYEEVGAAMLIKEFTEITADVTHKECLDSWKSHTE